MRKNLKVVGFALISVAALSACNSGTASDNSSLKTFISKIGVGSPESVHFNCSSDENDICNAGNNLILKTGTSGSKQDIKLIVPAVGYGIVQLAIHDQNGQSQDKVKFGSGSTNMTCDFTSTTSCKLTVDATNGEVGKDVKIVALKNDTQVASIGVTVKDGGSTPPLPTNNWGSFVVVPASNLTRLTFGEKSSFTITLNNSKVTDNNVSIPLSFDSVSNKNLVTLNTETCYFTSTNKTCTVEVTANTNNLYGSNTLEFNHRKSIIGEDKHDYGIMDVITIAVPDPSAVNDTLKTPKMVSNTYSEYNTTGSLASFIVRGPKLDTVYSLKGQFMKTVLDNIKQSDPIAYEKDFGNGAKVDSNGDIDVNFDEIQLSSTSDSNPSVFVKGNSEIINYNGKNIKITVADVIADQDPQSHIPETKTIIDKIYKEAKVTTIPTIYYAHCTQGMDRTGYFTTWYLVHAYQNSDKQLSDSEQYNNVVKLGLVRWSNGATFDDLNFNGKSWQGSNKVAQIPVDMKEQEGFHTSDSFWNNYPADQSLVSSKFGAAPNASEYAFTLPLCGSYDSVDCISVNANKVTISADLNGYDNVYISYADSKGKVIAIDGPLNKSDIQLNKPVGTAMIKIYVVNNNINAFVKEKVAIIK